MIWEKRKASRKRRCHNKKKKVIPAGMAKPIGPLASTPIPVKNALIQSHAEDRLAWQSQMMAMAGVRQALRMASGLANRAAQTRAMVEVRMVPERSAISPFCPGFAILHPITAVAHTERIEQITPGIRAMASLTPPTSKAIRWSQNIRAGLSPMSL